MKHWQVEEGDYLEKRRFVCPDCENEYIFVIFQRPIPWIVDCKCGWSCRFDWKTEKFQDWDYDLDGWVESQCEIVFEPC